MNLKVLHLHVVLSLTMTLFFATGCCTQTARACPEGANVHVSAPFGLNTTSPENCALKWRIGNDSGTLVSSDHTQCDHIAPESTDDIETWLFPIPWSVAQVESSEIEIEFYIDDALVVEETLPLEWELSSCNIVYGPSWCDVDQQHTAEVQLQL